MTLTQYQRKQIRDLETKGWTFVRVRRFQDDLNDWASVEMRTPRGESQVVGCPVSRSVEQYYLGRNA